MNVNSGTLSFSADANLGAAANAITLGTATTGAGLSFTGASITSMRGMTLGTFGGNTIGITNAAATLTLNGIIGGGPSVAATTALTTTGNITLGGANTFTGALVVSTGTLKTARRYSPWSRYGRNYDQ